MSWYSDGEPFDEFEPEYCKWCSVPPKERTYEGCRECEAEHDQAEREWEEEREEHWDVDAWRN